LRFRTTRQPAAPHSMSRGSRVDEPRARCRDRPLPLQSLRRAALRRPASSTASAEVSGCVLTRPPCAARSSTADAVEGAVRTRAPVPVGECVSASPSWEAPPESGPPRAGLPSSCAARWRADAARRGRNTSPTSSRRLRTSVFGSPRAAGSTGSEELLGWFEPLHAARIGPVAARALGPGLRRRTGAGTSRPCGSPPPGAAPAQTARRQPGTSRHPRRRAVRTGTGSRSTRVGAG
jgi:hypothetical protein